MKLNYVQVLFRYVLGPSHSSVPIFKTLFILIFKTLLNQNNKSASVHHYLM